MGSTSKWQLLKENPILFICILILLLSGFFILFIPTVMSSEPEVHTIEQAWQGTTGHGKELEPGDRLEIEYEVIKGENVDVYLEKGEPEPFDYDHKNAVIFKENSKMGYIEYDVYEDDIYMINFEGENFEVEFTFNVIEPGLSTGTERALVITGGLLIILLAVFLTRYHFRMKMPKYYGHSVKILLGGFLLVLFLVITFDSFQSGFDQSMVPTLLVGSLSILIFYSVLIFDKHYWIRTRLIPNEASERIKDLLERKKLSYISERMVRRRLNKFDEVLRLDLLDSEIKIKRQRGMSWKTFVFVGRRNKYNKNDMVDLTNDIALELETENFRPVSA